MMLQSSPNEVLMTLKRVMVVNIALLALAGLVLPGCGGDNPSGEVFYFSADALPEGGQDAIRRVLFVHGGSAKTLLEIITEKNAAQGRPPATRADLRFGSGPDSRIFLLNKRDGTIREIVP
jgi:hypothetical protein